MPKSIIPAELTIEERNLIGMYRRLNEWERLAFFMIMQSVAFGSLAKHTDSYSMPQMRKALAMNMRNGWYRDDSGKKSGARHA